MKRITAFIASGFVLACVLIAAPASAQNARSFVSGHGNDAAACTLAAPCRTLAHALTQTNAGGEIDVLDAAGYGSMVINKAISIVNDGVGTAGVIVPSGGTGIAIIAGANDAVSLRGLSIEGTGTGSFGITFSAGKSLTVENCVIRHVTNNGIYFLPDASASLTVSNSLIADNGGQGIDIVSDGSGTVSAVFNRVRINNNSYGIIVDGSAGTGTLEASVYDSVVTGHGGVGIYAFTTSGQASVTLMVFNSVAANNATGLEAAGSGATLRVVNSMVTGNNNGWQVSNSGVVESYGDNSIDGNAANEAAPPGTVLK